MNFSKEMCMLLLVIDGGGIPCEISLRGMPLNLTDK